MGRRTKLRLGPPFPSPRTRLRTARHNPRHLPLSRLRLPHDRQPLQTTPSKFITASSAKRLDVRVRPELKGGEGFNEEALVSKYVAQNPSRARQHFASQQCLF